MNRNKWLLLKIGSLLIVGFMITSFASFMVSRKSLRHEIETNTLPLTGDNIYSEIQRDLLRPVFISSLMASDTFLRDWILTGEEDPIHITKYLREIKNQYKTFTAFLVSDKTLTYYHVDGILKKVSPDEPRDIWYYRVQAMDSDFEINVDADLANRDAMTVFVNYRVFDYAGNYIGATGVGLNVSAVRTLMEEYQRKFGRSIFFITENGDIPIAGSDLPDNLKNIRQRPDFPEYSSSTDHQQYHTYMVGDDLIHSNIRYIPEFEWFLVVEQTENKATRDIRTTLLLNLVLCLLVTVVVLVLVNVTLELYRKRIATLRGIVPICSYCKQIRDDQGYWSQVEAYVAKHTEAEFSHGIFPGCLQKHHPDLSE